MARTLCCVVACVLIAVLIAGCGGGGGGPALSGGYGTITGSVSELPLGQGIRAASGPITLTVDGTSLSTQAGSDGSFVIEHVPVGMRTLVAHTNSKACAVVVGVENGRETSVGEMVLSESGQISGLVTDATTHAPIVDALVMVAEMVYSTDGELPHPVRVRRTNADGSYTVSALPTGRYLVTITKDGYVTCSLDLIVAVGTTTPGDAALQTAPPAARGAVTGTAVLQTDSGQTQPVPGVLVRLVPISQPVDTRPLPGSATDEDGNPVNLYHDGAPPMPPIWVRYYTYTDENGVYALDGIPAGQYTAVAVRPGLQVEEQPVTIIADQTTTLNFTMHLVQITYGVIEGVVTDSATGNPIAGTLVHAAYGAELASSGTRSGSGGAMITADTSICVMDTHTDESGHYVLKVPERVNAVLFAARGYEAKSLVVEVVPNGSVTLNAALEPTTVPQEFTLSGQVRIKLTADGESVRCPGAQVVAALSAMPVPLDAGMPPLPAFLATADENGNYSMKLPAGEYRIFAVKDYRQSAEVTIRMNENKTQNLLIPYSDGGVDPPPPPPM